MINNKPKIKQTEVGQIPEDWEILKIKDIGRVVTGKTPSSSNPEYFGDTTPFITPTDFKSYNKNIRLSERFLSEDGKRKLKNLLIPKKSVIVTCIGSDMGKVGLSKTECITNQQINSIIVDQEKASSDFVYYYFKSIYKFLRGMSTGGSTMPIVNKTDFENIEIVLPLLAEQQNITEVLGALDEKIELNRKMNKTLESIGQAIFKRWFSDSHNKQSNLVKLGEKITILKGKNITKKTITEGKVPVVAGGLNPSCYHDTSNTTAPVITISASGANAGFIRLYHENVWASDCSYLDKSVTPYVYFYYLFLLENKEAVSGLQRGSAQPHVYPKDLMEIKITDFDEKLIQKFEEVASPIFELKSNNIQQIETLSQIRDSLLPRLMSGKLRVR